MDINTHLLRQVNPGFVQEGRITSQVFLPTPKDENKLSVYDGDLITASDSWKHFTGELRFPSTGVVAVTVGECSALALPAQSDSIPFPEHAVINFEGQGTSSISRLSKKLKAMAEARGWLFSVA